MSTTTKKPTKKVTTVSSAADFKKAVYAELELPSGNVCLARRPGLQKLVMEGRIPNSLSGIVQDAMSGAGGESVKKSIGDMTPQQLEDAAKFTDLIVVECVNQPKVLMPPESEDDRQDDLLYVDEVDDQDKNFILNWAFGGTSIVEKFREQQAQLVADLQSGKGVE